ncbi:sodium channel regulatory subunit beta-1-like [Eudromia elegans]
MSPHGPSLLLGLLLAVSRCHAGCVEVTSHTEAVLGAPFRLLCISCKRRSETVAEALGEWYFREEGGVAYEKILRYEPEGPAEVAAGQCGILRYEPEGPAVVAGAPWLILWYEPEGPAEVAAGQCGILRYEPEGPAEILRYEPEGPVEVAAGQCGILRYEPEGPAEILRYEPEGPAEVAAGRFAGLLVWNGSRGTRDLQDLSVLLTNVSARHAGHYVCRVERNLTFEGYVYSVARNQSIRLAVVERATRDVAAVVSEVMMYVLIVVLTVWLAAEMLYCYRKVAAAGATPPPDSASEYLAIAAQSKENCAGVQVVAE